MGEERDQEMDSSNVSNSSRSNFLVFEKRTFSESTEKPEKDHQKACEECDVDSKQQEQRGGDVDSQHCNEQFLCHARTEGNEIKCQQKERNKNERLFFAQVLAPLKLKQ